MVGHRPGRGEAVLLGAHRGLAALGVGATVAILSVIEGETDDGSDGGGIDEAPVARIPLLTIRR